MHGATIKIRKWYLKTVNGVVRYGGGVCGGGDMSGVCNTRERSACRLSENVKGRGYL
jgi:hypothetical protein